MATLIKNATSYGVYILEADAAGKLLTDNTPGEVDLDAAGWNEGDEYVYFSNLIQLSESGTS